MLTHTCSEHFWEKYNVSFIERTYKIFFIHVFVSCIQVRFNRHWHCGKFFELCRRVSNSFNVYQFYWIGNFMYTFECCIPMNRVNMDWRIFSCEMVLREDKVNCSIDTFLSRRRAIERQKKREIFREVKKKEVDSGLFGILCLKKSCIRLPRKRTILLRRQLDQAVSF